MFRLQTMIEIFQEEEKCLEAGHQLSRELSCPTDSSVELRVGKVRYSHDVDKDFECLCNALFI